MDTRELLIAIDALQAKLDSLAEALTKLRLRVNRLNVIEATVSAYAPSDSEKQLVQTILSNLAPETRRQLEQTRQGSGPS